MSDIEIRQIAEHFSRDSFMSAYVLPRCATCAEQGVITPNPRDGSMHCVKCGSAFPPPEQHTYVAGIGSSSSKISALGKIRKLLREIL